MFKTMLNILKVLGILLLLPFIAIGFQLFIFLIPAMIILFIVWVLIQNPEDKE